MDKTTITLATILLVNLARFSEGLNCYTCANVVSGSIIGYEEDDSCKWGSKPNDKFLRNCEDSGTQQNEFDFICTELRVDGFNNDEDGSRFVGTLRGCGARIKTPSQQQLNVTKTEDVGVHAFKECQQGRLDSVKAYFQNPTGQEYLEGMAAIFNGPRTTVKFCACDVNACWETEQEVPEVSTTTTSTTTTEGGTSGVKSTIGVVVSVFVLLGVFSHF